MSLSYADLQAKRKAVEETVGPIECKLEALGNDIKEIYAMTASTQKSPDTANSQKLNLEEKILELHSELVEAAKRAGITLPSH